MLFCPNIQKRGKTFEISTVLLLKKIFETKPKLSGNTCYFGFTTLLLPFIISTDENQTPFSMRTTTEADALTTYTPGNKAVAWRALPFRRPWLQILPWPLLPEMVWLSPQACDLVRVLSLPRRCQAYLPLLTYWSSEKNNWFTGISET